MKLACFLLMAALLLTTTTPAKALTGTELNRFCNEPHGTLKNAVCFAYIRGLIDGLFLADNMAASGRRYCPPADGLDVEQAVLIVQKEFQDHPDQLNREAGAVAALALYLAFPCKGSN